MTMLRRRARDPLIWVGLALAAIAFQVTYTVAERRGGLATTRDVWATYLTALAAVGAVGASLFGVRALYRRRVFRRTPAN